MRRNRKGVLNALGDLYLLGARLSEAPGLMALVVVLVLSALQAVFLGEREYCFLSFRRHFTFLFE